MHRQAAAAAAAPTTSSPPPSPMRAALAHRPDGAHPLEQSAAQRVEFPTDLQRVQRKWQMASVNHFLHAFAARLPLQQLSPDAAEDLTPHALERAVAAPERDAALCTLLRDVIMALLVALDAVSLNGAPAAWFHALRVLVVAERHWFGDCFQAGENVLEQHDDGMHFLTHCGWHVRLGLLLALCDLAAERAPCIRDAIRDAELASTLSKSELERAGMRLQPLGRCSQRRFHYKVGKTRIYSGYKRKGNGALLVECSDSASMAQLADALSSSPFVRDVRLADEIRTKFLAPLRELEERARRKALRKSEELRLREQSRRRNASRPRRTNAAYL